MAPAMCSWVRWLDLGNRNIAGGQAWRLQIEQLLCTCLRKIDKPAGTVKANNPRQSSTRFTHFGGSNHA